MSVAERTTRILVHGFIESRRITHRVYETITRAPNTEVVGWVARPRFTWVFNDPSLKTLCFEEPLPSSGEWRVPLDADPRLGLSSVVADESLRFLLDREMHFEDQYELTLWRNEVVCYAQEIIDHTRPDALLFSDAPHSALSYALYLCAQARGIATLYFRFGPAPYLFAFCDRIGTPLYDFVRQGIGGAVSEASSESERFLDRLSGSYDAAAPPDMRKQLSTASLTSRARYMMKNRPRELLSRDAPAKIRTNLRRSALRSRYEKLAIGERALPGDFVALYLHLQPERTTVPEGGLYAQQWLIAHAIARALPPGWALVVREHPSTFLTGPRLVRNPGFYEALMRIPRVRLVSTAVDPFQLLDAARCVATVTGTVGFEAIARGTPALVFGDAAYLGCPGAFGVGDPSDVAVHLQEIAAGVTLRRPDVLEFLANFENSPRVYVSNESAAGAGSALDRGDIHAAIVARMLDFLARSQC